MGGKESSSRQEVGRGHDDPGDDPGDGIYQHQRAELMMGADHGEDPDETEGAGAQDGGGGQSDHRRL